ncbi:MAG: hypothetical protein JXA25_15520 [Anaerolineales bacterium]|nr:hypothetical protein [Anaerolineales bacterium]
MTNVFPGYGKMQLHRIMSCLSSVKIEEKGLRFASINYIPIRMFPNRALIMLISSAISTDLSFFKRLRASGYQVCLISPDPIHFTQTAFPENINSRLAVRAAALERAVLLKNIARLQISVVDWKVEQPLFPLVCNALTRSRGQQKF